MCDICVMNKVKEKMLSRRQFFSASAATGAAALLGATASAPPAMADGHSSIADLTHTYDDAFPWTDAIGVIDHTSVNYLL